MDTCTKNQTNNKKQQRTFLFICINSGPIEGCCIKSNEKPDRATMGNEKQQKATKSNNEQQWTWKLEKLKWARKNQDEQ